MFESWMMTTNLLIVFAAWASFLFSLRPATTNGRDFYVIDSVPENQSSMLSVLRNQISNLSERTSS